MFESTVGRFLGCKRCGGLASAWLRYSQWGMLAVAFALAGCDSLPGVRWIGDVEADQPAGAVQLTPDGGQHGAAIDHAGDVDYFKFQATAGQVYQIATSGDADTVIELYDRDGTTILQYNDDSGINGGGSGLAFTPESSGVYFLAVALYSKLATGPYVVSIAAVEDDFGNTCSGADMVTPGTVVAGAVNYTTDVDFFRVAADGGATYRLNASGVADLVLVVLADDGATELAYATNQSSEAAEVLIESLDATSWCVAVGGASQGGYTLEIEKLPADDHGATAETATMVQPDGEPTVVSIDYVGDIDLLRFETREGMTYRIETRGEWDTVLTLLTEDGVTPLDIDDDSGEEGNAQITWEATETESLVVFAELYDPEAVGSFEVVVETVASSEENPCAEATAVEIDGELVAGNLEVAEDVVYFVLSAEAGQGFLVETVGERDTFLTLFGSNGVTPLIAADDGGEDENGRLTWFADEAATYCIEVFNAGVDSGAFQIVAESIDTADDHGDSPAAATILPAGSAAPGASNFPGDVDYFQVELEAGVSYRIETTGEIDSILTLIGADGETVLAEDDDSGDGLNASIAWTAEEDGFVFIAVETYFRFETGADYVLTVAVEE